MTGMGKEGKMGCKERKKEYKGWGGGSIISHMLKCHKQIMKCHKQIMQFYRYQILAQTIFN
jgi:hypothetical protein